MAILIERRTDKRGITNTIPLPSPLERKLSAQTLLFFRRCHEIILESVCSRHNKDCAFKAVLLPASAHSPAKTIVLKLLGEDGITDNPSDIYRPATTQPDFRLCFRTPLTRANRTYEVPPRNIITNAPHFLDAMTRSFRHIRCMGKLLDLLREEEAFSWDGIAPSDQNFENTLSKQSMRHREIAAYIHYVRSIAVLGTGIRKGESAAARSQSRVATGMGSILALCAAHHTFLAESIDDYPEALASDLLNHFRALASGKQIAQRTSQRILDLVALGISYENARNLFYRVFTQCVSPEGAITELKEHLLKDFYSVLPDDIQQATEGASVPHNSPVYFLSQLTAICPQGVNATDCVLEIGKIAFSCPEIPLKEWNSRELALHLYTLVANYDMTPERSLEILNLFLKQLIEHERGLLRLLSEARDDFNTGIQELILIEPTPDTETHLETIRTKITALQGFLHTLNRCYEQLSTHYKSRRKQDLLTLSTSSYTEWLNSTTVLLKGNIIGIDKSLEVIGSYKEGQKLEHLMNEELKQCRNNRRQHERDKKEHLAKIVRLERQNPPNKPIISRLKSRNTAWDGVIARAAAREKALHRLSIHLREKGMGKANAAAVASLFPSYRPSQPIECVLQALSSGIPEGIGTNCTWQQWVTGTNEHFYTRCRQVNSQLIVILGQPLRLLDIILESQKEGFMKAVHELKDGTSRPTTNQKLLQLGRALRATSIPFEGIPLLRR